jgi:hypothetical protein
MSNLENNFNKQVNFVTIKPNTQKVIFYNAHASKTIEFYGEIEHYCMDIVFRGTNVLCLCNEIWRSTFGSQDIRVFLNATSLCGNSYYLRQIECSPFDNFTYFRIEKLGHYLSSPYACILQIKAHFYTENYVPSEDGFPEYIPLAIRTFSTENVHIMKPHFYGFDIRSKSCIRTTPLSMHWNL